MLFLLTLFAWSALALPNGWDTTPEKLLNTLTTNKTCYKIDSYDSCEILDHFPVQPDCDQVELDPQFQDARDNYELNNTQNRFENCTIEQHCAKYENRSFHNCSGCSDITKCIDNCFNIFHLSSSKSGNPGRSSCSCSSNKASVRTCVHKCKPNNTTYPCDFRDVCISNIPDLSCGITFDTCYSVNLTIGFTANDLQIVTRHANKTCSLGIAEDDCVTSLLNIIKYRTIYYDQNNPNRWTIDSSEISDAISSKYSLSMVLLILSLCLCIKIDY